MERNTYVVRWPYTAFVYCLIYLTHTCIALNHSFSPACCFWSNAIVWASRFLLSLSVFFYQQLTASGMLNKQFSYYLLRGSAVAIQLRALVHYFFEYGIGFWRFGSSSFVIRLSWFVTVHPWKWRLIQRINIFCVSECAYWISFTYVTAIR